MLAKSHKTPRPARLAQIRYDGIGGSRAAEYHESVIDLRETKRTVHKIIGPEYHSGLTIFEFRKLAECVQNSELFKEKLKGIQLPPGFELVIDPWPYGAPDEEDGQNRYFQALCFGKDTASGNDDSNFYAFPIPLMDARKNELVRIDEPATGGSTDPFAGSLRRKSIIDQCQPAEYVPELLPSGTRKDVKPLTVQQPKRPSFTVLDSNLISWQKWQMRVTFNSREGAVLHDIRYDGRDVLYRLSLSDMTAVCGPGSSVSPQASLRFRRRRSRTCGEQSDSRMRLPRGYQVFRRRSHQRRWARRNHQKRHLLTRERQRNQLETFQLEDWTSCGDPSPRARSAVHHHPGQLRVHLRLQIRPGSRHYRRV